MKINNNYYKQYKHYKYIAGGINENNNRSKSKKWDNYSTSGKIANSRYKEGQIHEFEKIKGQYPHLDEAIKAIEDTLPIWRGKIQFYDKAIGYLEDIIEERGLDNILDRKRSIEKC